VVLVLLSSELYLQAFSVRVVESIDTIHRTAERFEGKGRARYKRAKTCKRSTSLRADNLDEEAEGNNKKSTKQYAKYHNK
jgi:hypothetical protein